MIGNGHHRQSGSRSQPHQFFRKNRTVRAHGMTMEISVHLQKDSFQKGLPQKFFRVKAAGSQME